MEHFVADILLAASDDGDTRVNIGEQTDSEGFGADTAVWGNGDGFLSVPNPPSAAGVAQALVVPEGNEQRVVATRDNRFAAKAGALSPGDRAIVSDSAAFARLTRATDRIELASTDMGVALDGAGAALTITMGDNAITMTTTSITMTIGSPAIASLTLDATGVSIVGVLKVGGVAVVVP